MRNLARPSFFRFFDLLLSTANPGLKHTRWTFEGVAFERARHSFTGAGHTFIVETFTLRQGGRRGWNLMVVKEYWSFGDDGKGTRTTRWARPMGGKRSDLMAWLRAQEAALERALQRSASPPDALLQTGREFPQASTIPTRRPLTATVSHPTETHSGDSPYGAEKPCDLRHRK